MSAQQDNDIINIIYKVNDGDSSIKVFGSEFVRNNKSHCRIIYDNNEFELQKEFDTENIQKELKIKLLIEAHKN